MAKGGEGKPLEQQQQRTRPEISIQAKGFGGKAQGVNESSRLGLGVGEFAWRCAQGVLSPGVEAARDQSQSS